MTVDVHLHLDDALSGDIDVAVADVRRQMVEAGVTGGWLIHLLPQPWSLEDFARATSDAPELATFAHIDPAAADASELLTHAVRELGFTGLKLHPRLTETPILDPRSVALGKFAAKLSVPIVVDLFPDGNWLMAGGRAIDVARFATQVDGAPVVAAHMGGHECLDLLMTVKRVPNLWMDCSYSLLYYDGSRVVDDMVYGMKSMRFERVMYGSDHPDRPLGVVLERTREILFERGVTADQQAALFSGNAASFLAGVGHEA